jgi:predicted permease
MVDGAGAVSNLPLSDAAESGGFAFVGQPTPEAGRAPQTEYFVVEGEYFRTMGIKLVSGRLFNSADVERSARVAVVNREFVRQYLGTSALDRQIIPYFDFSPGPRTIVGVVDDVHYGSLDVRAKPQVYVPEQQMAYPGLDIVLHTRGDPMALLPVLKRELRAINGSLAVSRPRAMSDVVAESLARRRFSMTLIGIFAGSALALAIVGLYGVIALSVSQRRRELGIRMALGAQSRDVMELVLGEGLRITGIGIIVGLAGAVALSRVVTSLLYEVSPTSPTVYAAATIVVIAVTLVATYVPARRATAVDPTLALRTD